MDRSKWRKLIKDVWWSGWVWVGECFFWYRPTRVVPDQRPLNGCVCVCVGSERFSFKLSSNMCCLSQHYVIELSRPRTVISRIRYRQSQADNEHLCLSPAKRSNVTELLALNFLSLSSFSAFSSYCNDENSRASVHCDGIGQAMLAS